MSLSESERVEWEILSRRLEAERAADARARLVEAQGLVNEAAGNLAKAIDAFVEGFKRGFNRQRQRKDPG